jgi:Damage-control phosphatase ARMT1-like domain
MIRLKTTRAQSTAAILTVLSNCTLLLCAQHSASSDVFAETLAQGSANLLADDQERVTAALQAARSSSGARVDIVVDNAGFELFCDLCLADYLVTCGAASVVVSAVYLYQCSMSLRLAIQLASQSVVSGTCSIRFVRTRIEALCEHMFHKLAA